MRRFSGSAYAALTASLLFSAAASLAQDAATSDADAVARAKSEEELRKLKFENDKAEREEKDARRKAVADSFPSSTTSGATEIKTGAGQVEASALTAVAIMALADDIADDTQRAATRPFTARPQTAAQPCTLFPQQQPSTDPAPASTPVLLIAGDEKLNFGQWQQFRFRTCIIDAEFKRNLIAAKAALDATPRAQGGGERGGFGAGVGTAVTVASKLLQLVSPDWEVGGITVSASDRALVAAVAREYIKLDPNAPLYWNSQISKLDGSSTVFDALDKLNLLDISATDLVAKLKKHANDAKKKLDALAKKPDSDPAKKKARAEFDRLNGPLTALTETKASYASLMTHLNGKPGETLLPIDEVIKQAAVADLLGPSGVVLVLDVENAGGGYYKRKLIWDWLVYSGPPMYVTGGVTLTYFAIRPSAQQVLSSGHFICNAGYVKLSRVAAQANSMVLPRGTACDPVPLTFQAAVPATGKTTTTTTTNNQGGTR